MSDPWETISGTLPTRLPNDEVAGDVVEAAMLCGAITRPEEAKQLRRLVIESVKLAKLVGLERFEMLDELELRFTQTSSFEGIERAPRLEHLTALGVNVRALGPIGKLTKLRTLRVSPRVSVSLQSLDGIEGCTKLRHLEVGGSAIRSLAPLKKLTALRVLEVAETKVDSLAGLEKLRLTRLDLTDTPVADLGALAKMTSLRWLDISGTRVKDVKALAKLDQLRVLAMSKVKVRDLAPIAGLTRLVDLAIGRTPVANAAPLEKLTALRSLSAWDTKLPPDAVQALEAAAQERATAHAPPGLLAFALEQGLATDEEDAAEISHVRARIGDSTGELADLADLDRMPALRELTLGHGGVVRCTGGKRSQLRALQLQACPATTLSQLAHLEELMLSARAADVKTLQLPRSLRALELRGGPWPEVALPLPELRTFTADECRLPRIPSLRDCPNLVHLTIGKSYVADASPLAGHPALRSVALPHNRIADVAPLAKLPQLRRLDLDANPVATIAPLAQLAALRWLSLRQTPAGQQTLAGVEIER